MHTIAKYAVAAAVTLALGSTVALADDAKPEAKPAVSAAAGKDLIAAQKALQAKNYDEVLADLAKVKDLPKKNEYDDFLINEFTFSAYAGEKKYPEAFPPLEAAMASKYIAPDELKQRLGQAAILAYQIQNYDKSIEYGNRALKEATPTPQLQTLVAQSYYLKNDYKGADNFVHTLVDDQVKAGQVPTEDMLKLGLSATLKQNDEPGEIRWLELLAQYHPSAEYWENLIQVLYKNKLNDKQLLQVYRLSADVGTLKRGADYGEMAQLALDQGSPGEAVSTLTNGLAANAFTDAADKSRNQHLLDTAKKSAASDQPTLAKLETDGAASASGDKLVGVGIGYFSYGDYAKASKDIAAGLAKGMSKDPTDARLILGIAQFKTGDTDSAIKTFQSVKGDPTDERLAQLWIIHVKGPKAS